MLAHTVKVRNQIQLIDMTLASENLSERDVSCNYIIKWDPKKEKWTFYREMFLTEEEILNDVL